MHRSLSLLGPPGLPSHSLFFPPSPLSPPTPKTKMVKAFLSALTTTVWRYVWVRPGGVGWMSGRAWRRRLEAARARSPPPPRALRRRSRLPMKCAHRPSRRRPFLSTRPPSYVPLVGTAKKAARPAGTPVTKKVSKRGGAGRGRGGTVPAAPPKEQRTERRERRAALGGRGPAPPHPPWLAQSPVCRARPRRRTSWRKGQCGGACASLPPSQWGRDIRPCPAPPVVKARRMRPSEERERDQA